MVEGLEGCESLRKLDLTLNFIGKVHTVLTFQMVAPQYFNPKRQSRGKCEGFCGVQVSTVRTLLKNEALEELYLTGNPCCQVTIKSQPG